MTAKYICIEYPIKGEAIIIFPEMLVHKDVARNNAHAGCKIVSAGFITWGIMGFICHGESESLGIKSRPEQDSELVNFMFGRLT